MRNVKPVRPQLALEMTCGLAAYMLAYLCVWSFLQGPGRAPVLDSLGVAGPFLAAAFCLFAARRTEDRRLTVFWTLLAASALSSTLAGVANAVCDLALPAGTSSLWVVDLFWLLSYPLKFAAVVSLLSMGRRRRLSTVGVLLEALIFAVVAGVLAWQYLLLPSLWVGTLELGQLAPLFYPVGDVFLFATVLGLMLLPIQGRVPRGMLWVACSLAVNAIADLAYAATVLGGASHGVAWMDPLWPLALVLLGTAAIWRFAGASGPAVEPPGVGDRGIPSSRLTLKDQVRLVIPYVAMPVSGWVIYRALTSTGEPALLFQTIPLAAAFFLLGLILIRQYFTMLENRRLHDSLTALSHDLEDQVTQRTTELSLLNRLAFAMSRCSASRDVIQQGLQLAKDALGCEAAGLHLRVPGSRRRFFGTTGLGRAARLQLRTAAEKAFSEVDSQAPDRPAVVKVDRRGAGSGSLSGFTRHVSGLQSDQVIVAPLVYRQTCFGGLCVVPPDGKRLESSPQLELVSAIAAQMAVALENARRFEQAHYLAQRDHITGLLNHRGMSERLEEEYSRCLRGSSHFSVVVMDLDNFKLFNDTYGHAVGDEVLRRVARLLEQAARKSDVVARHGGDEFMALLPDTDSQGAVILTKRLQADIQEQAYFVNRVTNNRLPITLSCGVATYPNEGSRIVEILAAADANLYLSKQKGGNQVTLPSEELGSTENMEVFRTLVGLVTTVDNKDHYTRRHSDDVCELALALAAKLGLSHETERVLRIAALLHDVGKIGVPDHVLRKPDALTAEEFEAFKQHVVIGRLIIKEIPNLSEVIGAVSTHHERLDGSGYPDGLKGDQIPLLGRILAVADSYSAMTIDRPYRKALSLGEAVAELYLAARDQLDPLLVEHFVKMVTESAGVVREGTRSGAA